MGQYSEKNNIVISDVPLPEDSGMSLIGYLYQAGVNDGLASIEQMAEAQTETDAMTGLFTKNAFFIQAEKYLEKKKNASFCVAAVDIHHFRLFNQVFGRKQGDDYLLFVADSLKAYVQEYGGVACCDGADTFYYLAPDQEELFVRMEEDAREYMRSRDLEVGYAPKFGLYRILEDEIRLADACDCAATALRHVKKEYSRLLAWYDPSMNGEADEFKLLKEVELGLLHQEFTFYLQPKVDMNTEKIYGAEALARWIRQDNRIVAPMHYIPLLERNGLIFRLDSVIWEQVCRYQRSLLDRGYPVLPISVNVSRADIFSMDVADYIMDLVEKYELPVSCLEVEITEAAYGEEEGDPAAEIAKIKNYGFKVSMDDFGSSSSSLNSFKLLDVDELKIDMRFLDPDFTRPEKEVGILEFIVNMAESLSVPVVAEGVEFPEQVAFLTGIGCERAQGYYFYKPMRKEAFEDLLMDPDALA